MNVKNIALALMCAGALAGCEQDGSDIRRALALIDGRYDVLVDEKNRLDERLSSMQESGAATEQQLSDLRQQYAALALQLSSVGYEPIVEQPPSPVSTAEECVTIFRVQTCEDGVLHHLGSNFEWID